MGALRAAELAPLGMIGVGEVFRAFFDGDLVDDDEVAIAHQPSERGFLPVSDAMVNIRATVSHAFLEGVVPADLANELLTVAKALPYAERKYETVIAQVSGASRFSSSVRAFANWLPNGAVNQKRVDALAMCDVAHSLTAAKVPAPRVNFALAHTDAWENARRAFELVDASEEGSADDVRVLDELKVLGEAWMLENAATARALAERVMVGDNAELHAIGVQSLAEAHGIKDSYHLGEWLGNQGVKEETRRSFLVRHGKFSRAKELARRWQTRELLDPISVDGRYASLLERALAKTSALSTVGRNVTAIEEVWEWYLKEVLCLPPQPTSEELARRLGFDSVLSLQRAVAVEYAYRRHVVPSPSDNL
jgi:hypothetical protein